MSEERAALLRKLRRQSRFATAKLMVYAVVIVWLIWTMYSDHQRVAADRIRWDGELQQMDQMQKDLSEVKEGIRQLNQGGGSVPVSRGSQRETVATITAYTWTGQQTKSGTWPKEGRTCAGPTWIPFGTKVYIDGYGWRIVEDRTAKRFDGRYDVYLDSKSRCLEWGIQERAVKFQ